MGITRPEQVFEFPQEKSQITEHPEMFMEQKEEVVTQQPKFQTLMRRYHSHSGTADSYSEYVATATDKFKSKTLPRSGSHSPSPRPDSPELLAPLTEHDRSRGKSLPNVLLPVGIPASKRGGKPSRLKRRQDSLTDEFQWIPGLPVLEEATLDESTRHPLLQFSLHYDVQRCSLTVHLHHGSNLPAKDRGGTSDPFVVLYVIPNKEEIFESKVKYQTLDPIFDQSFEFKKLLPDDIRRQTLVMRVYDHDRFSKNDSIGGIILPLESADLFGVVMRMKIDENPMLFTEVRYDSWDSYQYDHWGSYHRGKV